MSEMVQKAALVLAESPLTTKVVMATGVGSFADRFVNLVPDIISGVGAIVATFAGAALYYKHRQAAKLDILRQESQRIENERMQLELDRYRALDQ